MYQFRCTFCKWKMKHAQSCILRVWSDTLSPATSSHDWLRTKEADFKLIYYDHTAIQSRNRECCFFELLSLLHLFHNPQSESRATSIQKFYPKLLKNSICHYITSYSLLGWILDWQTKWTLIVETTTIIIIMKTVLGFRPFSHRELAMITDLPVRRGIK